MDAGSKQKDLNGFIISSWSNCICSYRYSCSFIQPFSLVRNSILFTYMPDRPHPPSTQKLVEKLSQKNWKEWRNFIVIVLAFIGLWHVVAGGANVLRMFF
jgi:hypothetical protein